MNHVILVGSVEGHYKIVCNEANHHQKLIQFLVKVQKPFYNKNGETAFDYIKVKAWSRLFHDIDDQLVDQEIVSVKGRIQSFPYKKDNNEVVYINEIIAERIENIVSDF